MPKNYSSYQILSHDVKQSVYYDRYPQKVLTAQSPYNCLSYQTVLETMCIKNPNIRNAILENYQKN